MRVLAKNINMNVSSINNNVETRNNEVVLEVIKVNLILKMRLKMIVIYHQAGILCQDLYSLWERRKKRQAAIASGNGNNGNNSGNDNGINNHHYKMLSN